MIVYPSGVEVADTPDRAYDMLDTGQTTGQRCTQAGGAPDTDHRVFGSRLDWESMPEKGSLLSDGSGGR